MRPRGRCHGLGDRCDRCDGALDLDTRVWVCVVLVTLLGALLCREWRVRLSLLLEPVGIKLLATLIISLG
jgi:hypothetical protein